MKLYTLILALCTLSLHSAYDQTKQAIQHVLQAFDMHLHEVAVKSLDAQTLLHEGLIYERNFINKLSAPAFGQPAIIGTPTLWINWEKLHEFTYEEQLFLIGREVARIQSHELWCHMGTATTALIASAIMTPNLFTLEHLNPELYSYHEKRHWNALVKIAVALCASIPVFAWISRRHVTRADRIAIEKLDVYDAAITALTKLYPQPVATLENKEQATGWWHTLQRYCTQLCDGTVSYENRIAAIQA